MALHLSPPKKLQTFRHFFSPNQAKISKTPENLAKMG